MSPLLAFFALLPTFASTQASTRTLSQAELGKFTLVDYGMFQRSESKTEGNVIRWFALDFFNDLPEEVDSVDLRFWIEENGKTVYEQPVTISKFYVYPLLNFGGGLPDLLAGTASDAVPIDHPAKFWSGKARSYFKIKTVRAYVGDGDLHDVGRLYSWLKRTPESVALQKIKEDPSIVTGKNGSGMTSLGAAYAGSTVAVAKAMLASGAEFQSEISALGWVLPVVHVAAANAKPDMLAYLVRERGLPIDALSTRKETPLHVAFEYGRVENARWLLQHGANPNALDSAGKPPSFHAVMLKDRTGMDDLVKAGANLNYHNQRGYGLMQWVASKTFIAPDALEKLKSMKLSVDDVDPKFKITPLMVAALNGRYMTARWLLRHGAKLNAKDSQGRTVLGYARLSPAGEEGFRKEVLSKAPSQ